MNIPGNGESAALTIFYAVFWQKAAQRAGKSGKSMLRGQSRGDGRGEGISLYIKNFYTLYIMYILQNSGIALIFFCKTCE